MCADVNAVTPPAIAGQDQVVIAVADARVVALKALRACDVPAPHAESQVDLLIEAELRGRASHGLLRLKRVVERIRAGVANPQTRGRHTWRGTALLEVDGEMGLGPVVALAAVDALMDRARDTGVAVAAIRNNNHLGMLSWYVERVASAGKVAVALTTSEALVHPWAGRRAMVGTNPIAIGVPAEPYPFVLDMATGLVSMGKIHDYANRHQPIPGNWALDADGNPTTDPVSAKSGAIAPFGEAKGYGLALAFEVLVSALTGADIGTAVRGTLDSMWACNKGDLFMVLNSNPEMTVVVSEYLDAVRACAPIEPGFSVKVPGDRARSCRAERLKAGIPIATDVWRQLVGLADACPVQ